MISQPAMPPNENACLSGKGGEIDDTFGCPTQTAGFRNSFSDIFT